MHGRARSSRLPKMTLQGERPLPLAVIARPDAPLRLPRLACIQPRSTRAVRRMAFDARCGRCVHQLEKIPRDAFAKRIRVQEGLYSRSTCTSCNANLPRRISTTARTNRRLRNTCKASSPDPRAYNSGERTISPLPQAKNRPARRWPLLRRQESNVGHDSE